MITKTESKNVNSNKTLDSANRKVYAGINKAVKIEATETILEITNTASQVKIDRIKIGFSIAILSDKPNNTPKDAATPLPPLNLKNTVQMCPHTQLNPRIINKASLEARVTLGIKMFPIIKTQRNPFSTSRKSTTKPTLFPNTLSAFVAPTLPEPNLRMSIFLKSLPKIYAVGTEPIR